MAAVAAFAVGFAAGVDAGFGGCAIGCAPGVSAAVAGVAGSDERHATLAVTNRRQATADKARLTG